MSEDNSATDTEAAEQEVAGIKDAWELFLTEAQKLGVSGMATLDLSVGQSFIQSFGTNRSIPSEAYLGIMVSNSLGNFLGGIAAFAIIGSQQIGTPEALYAGTEINKLVGTILIKNGFKADQA